MKRKLCVVVALVMLNVGAFGNYLHSDIVANDELSFVGLSGAMVFETPPCCLNAVIFESSAYDTHYWFVAGIGYGMKSSHISFAGGFGVVGESFGPFVVADFYNQFLIAYARFIFGFSPCYSCINNWDIDVYLATHGLCPVTLEIQDTQVCDFRVGYFDLNVAFCKGDFLFPVVGCDNINGNRSYLGCRADFPQLQVTGKLYLNPCFPCGSFTALGLTLHYQF